MDAMMLPRERRVGGRDAQRRPVGPITTVDARCSQGWSDVAAALPTAKRRSGTPARADRSFYSASCTTPTTSASERTAFLKSGQLQPKGRPSPREIARRVTTSRSPPS